MLSEWLFLLLSMFAFAKSGDPPDPPDPSEEDAALEAEFDAMKDPKAKFLALKDQIGRLHRRLKERDKRIATLEAEVDAAGSGDDGDGGAHSGDANELRLENAFLRSAMAADEPLGDMELAWDLLHTKGFADTVKVGDDGKVAGMDDALVKLVERYPWLADADAAPPPDVPPSKPAVRGARKPQSSQGHTNSSLKARFPALQHRRGR